MLPSHIYCIHNENTASNKLSFHHAFLRLYIDLARLSSARLDDAEVRIGVVVRIPHLHTAVLRRIEVYAVHRIEGADVYRASRFAYFDRS